MTYTQLSYCTVNQQQHSFNKHSEHSRGEQLALQSS